MDPEIKRGLGWALIGVVVLVVGLAGGLAVSGAQQLFGLVAIVGVVIAFAGAVMAGRSLVRSR